MGDNDQSCAEVEHQIVHIGDRNFLAGSVACVIEKFPANTSMFF